MSIHSAPDLNVQFTVPADSPSSPPLVAAERRISPSWTIIQLKAKLEPVTGIPVSCQRLTTRTLDGTTVSLSDEDSYVGDSRYGLRTGSEIEITDSRPPGARQNFHDVSAVEKYEMPVDQYERLDDTVLAWKRRQKLGRFNPDAKSKDEMAEERRAADEREVRSKGIRVDERCRVGGEDTRRGTVKFVGEIEGLGGEKEVGCVWVGIELDEPVGRNDGTVKVEIDGKAESRRVFECREKFGVFARPEKIEVGQYPPLDDLDDDMEEL